MILSAGFSRRSAARTTRQVSATQKQRPAARGARCARIRGHLLAPSVTLTSDETRAPAARESAAAGIFFRQPSARFDGVTVAFRGNRRRSAEDRRRISFASPITAATQEIVERSNAMVSVHTPDVK
jgi:hypothetical protein